MAVPAAARPGLATAALLLVILGELVSRYGGPAGAADVAWAGMFAFLLLELSSIASTGRTMLAAAAALGGTLWGLGEVDGATVTKGLDAAAFFALFIGVLGFLRVAAAGSGTVRACGRILAHQRPGRRYLGLTVGAHVLGNLLNMSCLALLGSMIGTGNGEADRRRMLLACHRGFCAVPLWSPFAMTVALVLSLYPALAWGAYAAIGLSMAAAMILLGWAFDRLSSARTMASAATPAVAPNAPLEVSRPFLRLVALISGLGGAIFMLGRLTDVRLILAVLTCVPLFGLVWTVTQADPGTALPRPRAALRHVAHGLVRNLPALRNEVATLAGAAFIGVVAADVIDATAVGGALTGLGLSPAVTVALVPWAITAGALAGISPIVGIMVVGQVFAGMPAPRPPDVAIAAALTAGWACAVSVSPFTAVVLIIGRMAGRSPWETGPRWNGLFTLALLVVLSTMVYAVALYQ